MRSILLLLLAFGRCAIAHSDPSGDIHPRVSTSGNSFVVHFESRHPPDWKQEFRRMRFDASGSKIGETETAADERNPDPALPVKLSEQRTGLILADGNSGFYVVPEWQRKHQGKPYLISIRDSEEREIRPDWGDSSVDIVHDALLTPTRIILLVTEEDADEFVLVSIDPQTAAIERRRTVGAPSRIYWFSVNSNLIEFKGDVYFAWVGSKTDGWPLYLSRWSPAADTLVSVERPETATWNSSLSMARIGDRALLAYHYASDYPGYARIVTVAVDLTGELAGPGEAQH